MAKEGLFTGSQERKKRIAPTAGKTYMVLPLDEHTSESLETAESNDKLSQAGLNAETSSRVIQVLRSKETLM